MEIETVLVYSTADKDSLPVQLATYPICIGPANAAKSYLNKDIIVDIALKTECEAVHPGYGFLSENADFARKCEENGLVFIGPSAEIIENMGDKQSARKLMMEHKVPVVLGSKDLVKDSKEAKRIADEIGYPVLIKASAGGGGRGMRKAFSREEIENAFNTAKAEAESAFGNGDMYIEKLILKPHHIEFQILGDKFGNIIHIGERDCSIQRRNQKMIEESPSKVLSEKLRKKMGDAAVRAAKAAGYYSAGTIEFVLDDNENFYFIEMNTRIQVEHPITEEVTGFDIVKAQIKIAAGMPLSITQDDVKLTGHAIECRINAENPELNFRPSPGRIEALNIPGGPGVRIDSAVYQGYTITPFYDSMICKLIVHGADRDEAIMKMKWALSEFIVSGVDTNVDFQLELIKNRDFEKGDYDNGYLNRYMETRNKK